MIPQSHTRAPLRPGARSFIGPLALALCCGLAATPACDDPFPPAHERVWADFGTEVFSLLRDEYRWSSTPEVGQRRAETLDAHRDALVAGLNALIAPPVEDGLNDALVALLPLYDPDPTGAPGPLPAMTGDLATILDHALADPRTPAAIAALDAAPATVPDAVERFIGALSRHPIALIDRLVPLALELEDELTDLFRYLHRELPALEDDPPPHARRMGLIHRLLDHELNITTEPVGPLVLAARLDARGAPRVLPGPGGELPAPFVDADRDGLVDVDAFSRPVDAAGAPIPMPTFSAQPTAGEQRDRLGRAFIDGELVFDYRDLRQSALAWILRDGRRLLTDGAHFDLVVAFESLLGGRGLRDDADGSYPGFAVEAAPLLELVHVLNELRRYPRVVPLLRALEHVVTAREPLFRQLVTGLARAREILRDAPSLAPDNTLLEDLHPTLAAMAAHGHLRALLGAMAAPETQSMFDGLATMIKHTGLGLPADMAALETPTQVDGLAFTSPTPWERPDETDADRSWLQKAAYLMWDTRRAPAFLKLFDEVEIREVEITADMSALYVRAIAGEAVISLGNDLLDTLAVELVREFDDLTPSAEQLNLYMNHHQADTGNPVCNQGVQVRAHYGPALLALQTSGSLRSLRPWVREIVRDGRETDFVDLFAELAAHYSERAFTSGSFVSHGTGFRALEPYLVRVIEETNIKGHLLELGAWAHTATVEVDGEVVNVADELDGILRWLLDPDAGVGLRDGTTAIPSRAGGEIERPSRLQLLLHAFDLIDDALSDAPEARAAWDRVDLIGVFLDVEPDGQLTNRHALDLLVALVPILADELAEAIADPTWDASVATFVADVEDALGSRAFAAVADALTHVRLHPQHRALVDEIIAASLAEEPVAADADLFGATLEVLSLFASLDADAALTQLLRFVGAVLDPDARLVLDALEHLDAIRALDADRVLDALVVNLFTESERGVYPYKALKEAIKQVERLTPARAEAPGPRAPLDAADFTAALEAVRAWLRDDQRGAERLFDVVRSR